MEEQIYLLTRPYSEEKRDEISISSACALFWIVVPRNDSVALF